MKRHLCVGDSYALTKHKRTPFKRYFSLVAVLSVMCLYAAKQASAQQAEPAAPAVVDYTEHELKPSPPHNSLKSVKRLVVGDYLPEEFWETKYLFFDEGDSVRADLSAHKGKLLLLDFWATWCRVCIEGFPKLGKLQAEYENELEVILVNVSHTPDEFNRIRKDAGRIFSSIEPRSIIESQFLADLLISEGAIPRYVWISPRGQIIAITFNEFVNSDQVGNIVNFYKRDK